MGKPPSRRARKRFGQHFLEPAWVAKVVRAVDPAPADTFLEIGPGRGALTRPLAAQSHRVVAVEVDHDLARELAAGAPSNVLVVDGDFLDLTEDRLLGDLWPTGPARGPARVAANLPYNVAVPILFRLVDLCAGGRTLVDATLMLQREVADRLLAAPGSGDYGVLAILIRRHARVDRLLDLPPGAFRPPPKVRSAVVRLAFHPPSPQVVDEAVFSSLTRAIFTRRRKTLKNALLAYPRQLGVPADQLLELAAIDRRRRPETLDALEIGRLADLVATRARALVRAPRAVL